MKRTLDTNVRLLLLLRVRENSASYAWLFIEFFFRRFSPFGGKKKKKRQGAKGGGSCSRSTATTSASLKVGGDTKEEAMLESKKYE